LKFHYVFLCSAQPALYFSDEFMEIQGGNVRSKDAYWPLTGSHNLRSPLLPEDPTLHTQGSPGDYQRALAEGDLEGIVRTFEPDGYAREPSGGAYLHRGVEGLREL
jgi:hypothetical protein